jgi:hypothetical protein
MKLSSLLPLCLATVSLATVHQQALLRPSPKSVPQDGLELYLIELSPGETRWVSEEEKWDLKRVNFAFLFCGGALVVLGVEQRASRLRNNCQLPDNCPQA